jgi:5-methylcytosine-specific restriction endonuclease McrA
MWEAAAHRTKAAPPWNAGITYARGDVAEYSTKHGWTKAVIRVKGNRCENCGWDRAKCDVHHILPKSRGGKNTIDNARVLCPNCHREHHHA